MQGDTILTQKDAVTIKSLIIGLTSGVTALELYKEGRTEESKEFLEAFLSMYCDSSLSGRHELLPESRSSSISLDMLKRIDNVAGKVKSVIEESKDVKEVISLINEINYVIDELYLIRQNYR